MAYALKRSKLETKEMQQQQHQLSWVTRFYFWSKPNSTPRIWNLNIKQVWLWNSFLMINASRDEKESFTLYPIHLWTLAKEKSNRGGDLNLERSMHYLHASGRWCWPLIGWEAAGPANQCPISLLVSILHSFLPVSSSSSYPSYTWRCRCLSPQFRCQSVSVSRQTPGDATPSKQPATPPSHHRHLIYLFKAFRLNLQLGNYTYIILRAREG